jgi:hypothetical protein
MEAKAYNASQETELDRTIVELNKEMNIVIDRQVKNPFDASDYVIMAASQFREFMNVMEGFDDLNARP